MSKNRQRSSSGSQGKSPIDILIAKYGLAGTLIASLLGVLGVSLTAYFGYLGIQTQVEGPIKATQTAEAKLAALTASSITPPPQVTIATSVAANPSVVPTRTSTPDLATQLPPTTVVPQISPTTGVISAEITSTPIAPSTAVGTLLVKVPEGCGKIKQGDNFYITRGPDRTLVGTDKTNTNTSVAVGTYDIEFDSDFGDNPVRKGVVIRQGEVTVVDFTEEQGKVFVSDHPTFQSIPYFDISPNENFSGGLLAGQEWCGPAGQYKVSLREYFLYGGLYQPNSNPLALFVGGSVSFDIQVKAGETTTVQSEAWANQLGQLSFSSQERVIIKLQVVNLETGNLTTFDGVSSSGTYWVLIGTYRIAFVEPYPGLTYENVEITVGEETILQLPSAP